nr:noeC [Azorhizobium caulinodans ORS 571]
MWNKEWPAKIPFMTYCEACRPHHWLKNGLLFVPVLICGRAEDLLQAPLWLAFMTFCSVASGIYVLNDLMDRAHDRRHPSKRHRPFASRKLSGLTGVWMCLVLIALGGVCAINCGERLFAITASYVALSVIYVGKVRGEYVLDLFVLSALYTTRILAGATAANIPVPASFLAFSAMAFVSLASIKRLNELTQLRRDGAPDLYGRGYELSDHSIVALICVSAGYAAVVFLELFVQMSSVAQGPAPIFVSNAMCVVVAYWISRAVVQAHRGDMRSDTLCYAVTDGSSLVCILGLALGLVFLMYCRSQSIG